MTMTTRKPASISLLCGKSPTATGASPLISGTTTNQMRSPTPPATPRVNRWPCGQARASGPGYHDPEGVEEKRCRRPADDTPPEKQCAQGGVVTRCRAFEAPLVGQQHSEPEAGAHDEGDSSLQQPGRCRERVTPGPDQQNPRHYQHDAAHHREHEVRPENRP